MSKKLSKLNIIQLLAEYFHRRDGYPIGGGGMGDDGAHPTVKVDEESPRGSAKLRGEKKREGGRVRPASTSLLKLIIKETIRLHSPAPMLIHRETMNPTTLSDGFQIPPKTTIYVNAWSIDRDPDAWERPEVFNPNSFVNMEMPAVDSFAHYDFKMIPFDEGGEGFSRGRICERIIRT